MSRTLDSANAFAALKPSPLDPVLVSIEAFAADPRPNKVNLGVGMYYDEAGRIPLLGSVRAASRVVEQTIQAYGYQPVEGTPAFRAGVMKLLFGEASRAAQEGRIALLQCVGGTGALRIGADVLRQMDATGAVAVSDPSWVNHPVLFGAAGFRILSYPYLDRATGRLDFEAMLGAIETYSPGSIVVLHGCCHNPTGVDLDRAQWARLADTLADKRLIPFIDLAYQGFADGIDEDAWAVRMLAERERPLFVALSFSKSFALYGERVGALAVVTPRVIDAENVMGAAKNAIRAIYSTPPTYGAAIVSTVLNSEELGAEWRADVGHMRDRIKRMRHALVDRIARLGNTRDFSFMLEQRGLFSYSGLSAEQIDRMRDEHAIHAVRDGRLCMAALNEGNVAAVAEAIAAVV